MNPESEIKNFLEKQGADFVHFADISDLNPNQNKGFEAAVLLGKVLTREYIKKVSDTPGYVDKMKRNNEIKNDEFHLTEIMTDRLADELAVFLTEKGFKAYSQSEKNVDQTGYYNFKNQSTPLPHKTIAGLAGMGWIGKHNLLVTPEFGSAISMCSVLTNAPVKTMKSEPMKSKCGTCRICADICPAKAIKGDSWSYSSRREDLIDIFACSTCIECMMHCPFTQNFAKTNP